MNTPFIKLIEQQTIVRFLYYALVGITKWRIMTNEEYLYHHM